MPPPPVDPAWLALCECLAGPGPAEAHAPALWTIIDTLYQVPTRPYHNLGHVRACLAELNRFDGPLTDRDAVAFALWFHDCIYDPRRSDNEARSADIADLAALRIGLGAARREHIRALILATAHRSGPQNDDARAITDIDLSILGAPPPDYARYAGAIRAEYAFADDDAYVAGRGAFLRAMLARPRLFLTDVLHARLDTPARANLMRELASLAHPP